VRLQFITGQENHSYANGRRGANNLFSKIAAAFRRRLPLIRTAAHRDDGFLMATESRLPHGSPVKEITMFQAKLTCGVLAGLVLLVLGSALVSAQPSTDKVLIPVPSCGIKVSIGAPGSGARVVDVYGSGQLGNVQFQPGDIIYAIGGVNIVPGVNLDTLIAQANASGNRFVKVRDVNSGAVYTLSW
jgi:hypothetical protein